MVTRLTLRVAFSTCDARFLPHSISIASRVTKPDIVVAIARREQTTCGSGPAQFRASTREMHGWALHSEMQAISQQCNI
eukprot:6371818-Amphidinium_carterae.1